VFLKIQTKCENNFQRNFRGTVQRNVKKIFMKKRSRWLKKIEWDIYPYLDKSWGYISILNVLKSP